jgi:aspartate carbamoyltransferase catalytic subunit
MQAIEVFPSGDNEANLQLNADGTAAAITQQVANGVAVRMAVLECVCKAMEGR